MAALGPEEQELISKDREEHPGCFYSTALSQSCRAINGESKCEIIKKIFRQCPGQNKELISNRKEITEDEHIGDGGDGAFMEGDFFNRERMDARKSEFGANPFGMMDPFRQRDNDLEAQLSPFDFFRQEMLRPFESFFGGGFFGSGGGNIFDDLEREYERMPVHPPSYRRRPSNQPPPPPSPPHYSYHPADNAEESSKASGMPKQDIFAGYKGRVEEI